MSNSETQDLTQLNFTGGVPTSADFAPSIVFLIAFIATLPLLVWRIARRDSRCLDLIRPSLLFCARVGTYGLRAYMAKNTWTANDLIAELVLLSLGTLFLVEPLVGLWKRHCQSSMALEEQGGLMMKAASVLRLAILAAIILSILASSSISSSMSDPSKISKITTYREIAAVIQAVIVFIVMILTIFAHLQFSLDVRRTAYIFIPAISMAIVTVYRLAQTFSSDLTAPVHNLVVFWVCSSTFEFIAYFSLIAIKIPVWYPGAPKLDNGKESPIPLTGQAQQYQGQYQGRMEGGQMRYAAPQQPYPYASTPNQGYQGYPSQQGNQGRY